MAKRVVRDTPLAEITLRKYEPPSVEGRELIRKLCLSLGLLQPGDSRDVVVDVLMVLLVQHSPLSSVEVEERVIAARKEHDMILVGVASSNIRRQLLRLRDLFLVEKIGNTYRINENSTLESLFVEKVKSYLLESTVKRVREYLLAVDREFLKK